MHCFRIGDVLASPGFRVAAAAAAAHSPSRSLVRLTSSLSFVKSHMHKKKIGREMEKM